jgi:organic hydroperoxide reductase OsmC/OhrA
MAEVTIHRAGVAWEGGEGEDVRAHEVLLGAQSLAASSALEFGGDDTKANPETLLVGALSSCHMLWFLGLAQKKGFEVASYEDDAEGVLEGKRFSSATLRPRVRWAGDPPEPEAIEALHHRAHQLCFIANSVDFPVAVEPS